MFDKDDHDSIRFERSEKHQHYTWKYKEFHAIVDGKMCEGIDPAPEPTDAELDPGPDGGPPSRLPPVDGNRDPLIFHHAAFALVGKKVVFPDVDPWNDSSDDYAKKMVDSGNWEQIAPEPGDDILPLLRDHDILTWAFSEDGNGGCNDKPGMNGGNTTTGFLIEGRDDFPTLAYACCRYIPSGIFPLSEVLRNQEKFGTGLKARVIYIHRFIERLPEVADSGPKVRRVTRR
ncbi:hypothetical protein CMI37_32080 [Candidatus Pacearchaeota archaeon]|nr:hypothetical protein [Candidatus Pacearchaeota archaeon]|tara:strand:- start:11 stop:703 length:693 start_codon:yes stop_codon:yes gene_type:complete